MGCVTTLRASFHWLRLQCRRKSRKPHHPNVSVIIRLGSRSALLPPRIIVKNVIDITVSISSLTINYTYDLIATKADLKYPIRLEPGEKVTIPANEFQDPAEDRAIDNASMRLNLPYRLVANEVAVMDTTLDWMER